MYDVMIIDDDQFIRDRLKNMIKWDSIGIRLVCEAQDSDTARELFLLYRPKIIISDIQIPIISGLELAQEISVIDPQVRFIIITGYNDFKYAQTSIRLGAVDLLTKPILPERINASLNKSVAYFEKLKDDHIFSGKLRFLIKKNLPVFQEKFLSYLLKQTRHYTAKEIIDKLTALQMDLTGSYYTIVLICPNIDDLSAAETDKILVATKNTSNEKLLNAGNKVYSFYNDNYQLCCLISWDSEDTPAKLEQTIINIHDEMDFYWNLKILSSIGKSISDITKLHDAYNTAFVAYNYHGMLDNMSVIDYKNIAHFFQPIVLDINYTITNAIVHFRNNNLHEMSQLVQDMMASILSSTKDNIQPARDLIFKLTSSIITESILLGINTEILSQYSEIYNEILSSNDVQYLIKCMLDFSGNIARELFNNRSISKNKLIKMAKDFIKDNLSNNKLNLEMVSDSIGLSSIYFCKLFHKEEGVSFNSYLNLERINKAKTLLSDTNLKVFEISNAIGYSNAKYFNYVFKRIAGITPLEFRNS